MVSNQLAASSATPPALVSELSAAIAGLPVKTISNPTIAPMKQFRVLRMIPRKLVLMSFSPHRG
jgi:hypothetical protein